MLEVGKGGLPPLFRMARSEVAGGKPPFPTSNFISSTLCFLTTN